MKICVILGTRPEVIKLAPLLQEMKRDGSFDLSVLATGQHKEMIRPLLDYFQVGIDQDLDVMSPGQSLGSLHGKLVRHLQEAISAIHPDVIVVQGDTMSAMAAATVGFFEKIPVVHIEAGLRTGDINSPWPEEFNRKVISLASSLHFSPTEKNKMDLIREGIQEESIYVVGNTVIDSLRIVSQELDAHPKLDRLPTLSKNSKKVLLTVHRRENLGPNLMNIMSAIVELLQKHPDLEVVWPQHKNPDVMKASALFFKNGIPERLKLCEPLGYISFIQMMKLSDVIISDSGGVQEEAPFLGKPVLILRETTERQESVSCGSCKLIGSQKDRIVSELDELLQFGEMHRFMSQARYPYGHGDSSSKIVQILKQRISANIFSNPKRTSNFS